MSWAGLAAITLHERGGGVAAASRLMWRAVQERWPDDSRLVTLVSRERARVSLESSTSARLHFGARLAKAQVLSECRWVFYTHLAVAQVQRFLPSALQRPYGVFLHGIEAWGPLGSSERRALADASLLVANSRYTAGRIRDAHPWIGPIVVCPLALDEAPVAGDDHAAIPEIGPRAVLLVARMAAAERYKGHDQLLDAWPRVAARVPDARLVLVGTGDDVARLERKAAALGLQESVVFTGFVPAAVRGALYRRAALFAMPSRGEGFGLVYLEAMAHGLPCIGSTHDAAAEVIADGVTGWLIDQADLSALADRVVALLADERVRHEMGERGRTHVARRFAYDAFRDRFVGLVESSLSGAARTQPAGVVEH